MAIIALLIVVHDRNRIEEKHIGRGLDQSGARQQTSGTCAAADHGARNRRVGLALAMIVPTIIALILGVASFVTVVS